MKDNAFTHAVVKANQLEADLANKQFELDAMTAERNKAMETISKIMNTDGYCYLSVAHKIIRSRYED